MAALVPGGTARAAGPRPTDPDPTFGVGGVVTADGLVDSSAGTAVVALPGGKTLIAGHADIDHGHAVFVSRLLPDGSLDPSFGDWGRARLTLYAPSLRHRPALAVGSDGRPVVAVVAGEELVVVRLLADGGLDPSFGNGGRVVEQRGSSHPDNSAAVAVDPADGGIVVSAATVHAPPRGTSVFRYLTSGHRDGTFGGDGMVDLDPGGLTLARSLTLDGGRMVLAGEGPSGSVNDITITRVLRSGLVDITFGIGGVAKPGSGNAWPAAAQGVVVVDGKVLVTATSGINYEDEAMRAVTLRLTSSGALDPTFGIGGRAVLEPAAGRRFLRVTSLATAANGAILVAGDTGSRTHTVFSDAFAARFSAAGLLDSTFGNGGRLEFDSGWGDHDVIAGVAVSSVGAITLAGSAGDHTLVARRTGAGDPDPAFGPADGLVIVHAGTGGTDQASDAVVLPDGDVVVVGRTGDFFESDLLLARFDPTGALDTTFADRGVAVHDFGADSSEGTAGIEVDSAGRFVVAGTAGHFGHTEVFVARFLADGALDRSYGDDGVLWWADTDADGSDPYLAAHALALDAEDHAVVAAENYTAGTTSTVLLAADADGQGPLAGFGTAGRALTPVSLSGSGRGQFVVAHGPGLLVAGSVGGPGGTDVAVARHLANGAVDSGFGVDGVAAVDVADEAGADVPVTLRTMDEGILVLASSQVDGLNQLRRTVGGLVRLDSRGRPDSGFGMGGSVRLDEPSWTPGDLHGKTFVSRGVALDAVGRIVTVAEGSMTRHTADGRPDPTFDGDGFSRLLLAGGVVRLEILPDGRILGIAGRSGVIDSDLSLFRLLGIDSPLPRIDVADARVVEGEDDLQFRLTLDAPSDRPVVVQARLTVGTADGSDVYPHSDHVLIPAGATEGLFKVVAFDDTEDEGEETVRLSLFAPEGARIGDAEATGTIIDEDPPPVLSITDASGSEGDTLRFRLTLSEPSPATVEITAETHAQTATSPADFPPTYQRIVFPPGEVAATFDVPTVNDDNDEPDESFLVALYSPDDNTPARWSATGTIVDDDAPPSEGSGGAGGSSPPPATGTDPPPSGSPPDSQSAGPGSVAGREPGYWMLGSGGTVYRFGGARHFGHPAGVLGRANAADIEPTPSSGGYYVLEDTGRVHVYGDAVHRGDLTGVRLGPNERATSLSVRRSGGYWIFTSAGRVVPFGGAPHFGDMANVKLNGPVLDSVATPTGGGYYMVAEDGGIFTFGDAVFAGSMGGKRLNGPVQSLVPASNGGYWLVASDGGIFSFGGAPFRGSMGGRPLNRPVTGMVRYGNGYLMVAEDGGIFSFSDQPFAGSLGGSPPALPIVAVASG